MKTQSSFITCCVIAYLMNLSCAVHAQKNPMKFGKIEPEYFAMKSYDQDTSAEALILGDYGETRLVYDQFDGFILQYSRHFRAKIFKKTGYDWAVESMILYNYGSIQEEVVSLKGRVYNMENGKIVESDLEKSMINDEVIDKKRTKRKFSLPNVREGSIIEYVITTKSNYLFSIPDWQFQYTIPALWSEYRLAYPEYFDYKKLQKGYLSFDVNEASKKPLTFTVVQKIAAEGIMVDASTKTYKFDYLENNFRWIKNNVPLFKEEPFMNAVSNYVTCLQFELASFKPPFGMVTDYSKSWESINEEMLEEEDFGLQLKRGGFLREVADPLKANNTTPEKQVIAAFTTIRDAMKWNELYRVYVTQSLRNAWEKKSGSSADINLMLVALLKEMGIDADPVIISTRSNGIIHPAQIMLGQFNYVIASARIGEKTYLMDATEKTCPHNMLMPRCINGQGRVISETRPDWIDLNSTHRFEYTNMTTATIGMDGTIKGKMQNYYKNYAALDKRMEINAKKDKDDYIRSLENAHKGLKVSGYEMSNLDSLGKPYDEVLDVEITDAVLIAGNLITLTPLIYTLWDSNPFRLEGRNFPVDFTYPRIYKDVITYELPEGYTLDEKPADLVQAMPDGKTKFTYRLALNGNKLQVMSNLDIGKALYTVEEYAILKEFYGNLVKKQAEKIVLKKTI